MGLSGTPSPQSVKSVRDLQVRNDEVPFKSTPPPPPQKPLSSYPSSDPTEEPPGPLSQGFTTQRSSLSRSCIENQSMTHRETKRKRETGRPKGKRQREVTLSFIPVKKTDGVHDRELRGDLFNPSSGLADTSGLVGSQQCARSHLC